MVPYRLPPGQGHPRAGIASIVTAGEGVQHRLMARGIDLEHHARSRCAAGVSRSVEVAFESRITPASDPSFPPVKVYSTVSWPVVSTLNTTPEFDAPPPLLWSRRGCRPSRGSHLDTGCPIGPAREAVQHRLMARRIDLEDHTVPGAPPPAVIP